MSAVRWIIVLIVLILFIPVDYGIYGGSHSSTAVAIAGIIEFFIFLRLAWSASGSN